MTDLEAELARIRGKSQPKPNKHNARTISALATNPGCARRAIMDAAGVDKQRIAAHLGYPAPFGQSRFALARGNQFERQLKADGGAQILTLLRQELNLPVQQAHYTDLNDVGGNSSNDVRHKATRRALATSVSDATQPGTMFDHPLLSLQVAGRTAYLEPDLIALRLGDKYHVVEIKSFPIIDGQADGAKVAQASIQSAVYVLALRQALAGRPDAVSDTTILICPKDFSNQPVAAMLDVRKQLTVLVRQLDRMDRIEDLLRFLPSGMTFDPAGPEDLNAAVTAVDARYAPDCLNTCEMCYFCRHEARHSTAVLGKAVREDLGGVELIATALDLARGKAHANDQAEAAEHLRHAARLREEILGEAV